MEYQELADQLTAMNVVVDKIKTEIQVLIDAIGNADDVPQTVIDAANALAVNLQTADEMNTDAPTPDPEP